MASAESVQQGDPLGSLLFLALNKLLMDNGAEFVSGYLDDIGLGDTVPRLVEQFRRLECATNKICRQLNHDKCQILGLFAVSRPTWVRSVSTNMGSQCLDQHGSSRASTSSYDRRGGILTWVSHPLTWH